tara:strand:- start:149 stop:820 length:672 start_codon:yes stop_codon:yes gene_type:complete
MLDSLAFEGVGSFRNHIEPDQFIYNSIFTIFGNIILGYLYVKFGNSFSDRKVLAKNFVIISLTTMVIITIVKSSLALSLGLVGALSIVRFRTAIKEPEELSYLFVSIAIGLGFGANQLFITFLGLAFICIVIVLLSYLSNEDMKTNNLYIDAKLIENEDVTLSKIVKIISNNSKEVDLISFESSEKKLKSAFKVNFESFNSLDTLVEELKNFQKNIEVSFFED